MLAQDTAATIAAAKDLFARANRPNLFIKIPGTKEGLPAIEEAIFTGVPVNVTLLFSREQYLEAAQAFLRGIERRIDAGLKANVGSVASVFISRWDTAVNGKAPAQLRNKLGLAMASRVQANFNFVALTALQRGRTAAAVPGPHWVKDLGFAGFMSEPAAPFTIDTMPEGTLSARGKHNSVR